MTLRTLIPIMIIVDADINVHIGCKHYNIVLALIANMAVTAITYTRRQTSGREEKWAYFMDKNTQKTVTSCGDQHYSSYWDYYWTQE